MTAEMLHDPEVSQKLVVKLAGTVCNIDCTYCFEKDKKLDFASFMTPDVLAKALSGIDKPIELLFHGGEPLLIGEAVFQQMLEVVRTHRDKVRTVSIQTNGTLLNESWIKLLFETYQDLDMQISISLDGTPEMNKLRITYSGKPTFVSVRQAFNLLATVDRQAGLLSVIGRHALTHAGEYVEFLLSIPNLKFVKINPLYDSEPGALRPDSITPSQFTEFLKKVAIEWVNRKGFARFPMEPLLSYIQQLQGVGSRFCHFNRRKCLNFSTLYPDGRMGICDNFSAREFPAAFAESESFRGELELLARSDVTAPFREMLEKCQQCEILPLCQGGCLSQRLYFRRNVPALYEEYCEHRKEMFRFVHTLIDAEG